VHWMGYGTAGSATFFSGTYVLKNFCAARATYTMWSSVRLYWRRNRSSTAFVWFPPAPPIAKCTLPCTASSELYRYSEYGRLAAYVCTNDV
jgi:hypothetical protein